MKKVTKKFLSVVLALMTILSVATFSASAAVLGDDYKYRGIVAGYYVADEWNFIKGECTSFAAWRLNNTNGVGFHNYYGGVHWGHANNWDDAARALGIAVNNNPAVGAIAQTDSGDYGHVAWVADVNGNNVTIEEYNYGYVVISGEYHGSHKYNSRTVSKSSFVYIHIKDIPQTPPHSCSFNQKNTDSKYLASKATCTSAATYYYSCTCGAKGSSTFSVGNPLGHSYSETLVPATCTKDAYISCKCSRCGNTITKAAETTYKYSDWSTTKPTATGNSTVETQTQYRYKGATTREETSPINESGWTLKETKWKQTGSGTYCYFPKPNGFKSSENMGYASSPISGYENSTSKRVVSGAQHNSYIYWHWVCQYCYGVGDNCFIGDYEGEYINANYGYATIWEAFESATDLRWYTNSDGTVRVSDHSKYSYNWHISESYKQTYTDYQKIYVYTRENGWTDWSSEKAPLTATEVQTRTVYRLKTPTNDVKALGHNWGTPVVTKPATPTNTGTETVKCSRCGATETHIIPKITSKVTGVTVSDTTVKFKKSATIVPDVAREGKVNYTVTFVSSNPKAVMVNDDGTVYGVDDGSATVTCTVKDEFGNTVSDTCTVTVKLTFFQKLLKIFLPFLY